MMEENKLNLVQLVEDNLKENVDSEVLSFFVNKFYIFQKKK